MANETSQSNWTRWFAVCTVLIGCFILVNAYFRDSGNREEKAFKRFFNSMPSSVQLVAYGEDRDVFGGGAYALIFRIPETDLRGILERQEYKAIAIETDPGNWRLDFCNDILRRIGKVDFRIDPTFDCYSKTSGRTSVRVFYDKNRSMAVFLGTGKFPK
jgi:hypothetical protein